MRPLKSDTTLRGIHFKDRVVLVALSFCTEGR